MSQRKSLKAKPELTPKQERFVTEYLVDLNGTQAAIRAGYSKRTSNEQAARLLAKASIQKFLSAQREKLAAKTELGTAWVLQGLRTVAERCLQASPVLDRRGEPIYVETPNGDVVPAFTFEAAGANRAFELIGKHFGSFPAEKREVTGKDGAPLIPEALNELELARRVAFLMAQGLNA